MVLGRHVLPVVESLSELSQLRGKKRDDYMEGLLESSGIPDIVKQALRKLGDINVDYKLLFISEKLLSKERVLVYTECFLKLYDDEPFITEDVIKNAL